MDFAGNLLTDAMVSRHMREPDELYWSEVTMAILNGGAIRGSINQGISCRYLLNSHVFRHLQRKIKQDGNLPVYSEVIAMLKFSMRSSNSGRWVI